MVDVACLIEYRIAACTKRPSGPTGRTCYHTRQIDTRQRTHSPYLFRLRRGTYALCACSRYSRITFRPRYAASGNGHGREERVQRSFPFYYVNVMRIKLSVNYLSLRSFADFRSWLARYRQRWLETGDISWILLIVIFLLYSDLKFSTNT